MSVLGDILDEIVSEINKLELVYPPNSPDAVEVPVKKRKLPRVGETIDTLPMICVCPAERGEQSKRLGAQYEVKYFAEIVLISANNDDQRANLDLFLDWREKIRNLFLTEVGNFDVAFTGNDSRSTWDRAKISENYDYLPLDLSITTIERVTKD